MTTFGAFLDPVADKIMVTSALILLALSPPDPLTPETMAAPVMLIICREITMSALREWAAAAGGGAHKVGGGGVCWLCLFRTVWIFSCLPL